MEEDVAKDARGQIPVRLLEWKPIFLKSLAENGVISTAAAEAGVTRETARRHLESDKDFAEAWKQAVLVWRDSLRGIANRRALESDKVLIAVLQANCPEYKKQLKVTGDTNTNVSFSNAPSEAVRDAIRKKIMRPKASDSNASDGSAQSEEQPRPA